MSDLDDLLNPKPGVTVEKNYQSISLHVSGNTDSWTYWQKVCAAMRLIAGGNVWFSFCNSVEAVFGSDKKYLGLGHAGSQAEIEVSVKKPNMVDPKDHNPVTQIRVVKGSDLKLQ